MGISSINRFSLGFLAPPEEPGTKTEEQGKATRRARKERPVDLSKNPPPMSEESIAATKAKHEEERKKAKADRERRAEEWDARVKEKRAMHDLTPEERRARAEQIRRNNATIDAIIAEKNPAANPDTYELKPISTLLEESKAQPPVNKNTEWEPSKAANRDIPISPKLRIEITKRGYNIFLENDRGRERKVKKANHPDVLQEFKTLGIRLSTLEGHDLQELETTVSLLQSYHSYQKMGFAFEEDANLVLAAAKISAQRAGVSIIIE